ncbi:MAG: recombination mediator RecR [Elusimicrobia bacterium]|nr:recombination mediator RecR [Elusimicrobiota bacterium]
MNRPQAINKMIDSIKRLPGIGPKMAERLSYHLLKVSDVEVERLISAIQSARRQMQVCSVCFNVGEQDPCVVCQDSSRDKTILAVVETPQDLLALAKVKEYTGLYFVLGGALNPLEGIGPDDLRITGLINRLKNGTITEIIIATDTDSKGETTALYLAELIKHFNIKVTRLGYGLPVGGDIEYADEVTLSRAIAGRRVIDT